MLDSDDSTVFSDNNDSDSDDEDDDEVKVEAKFVKEQLEEVVIAAKSQLPSPRLQPPKLPSPKVRPLKMNKIKYSEKLVLKSRPESSLSCSDQDTGERFESPEPPVLLAADEPAAAEVVKEEPPKLKVVSKSKKHRRRSGDERGRKKSSKHKSKKSKKEKKRHHRRRSRSRSESPPKIDRESSLSPVRIKSNSKKVENAKEEKEARRRPSVRVLTPQPPPVEKVQPDKVSKIEKQDEKPAAIKLPNVSQISSFSKSKPEPVFDSKYRSLKPEEFWKKSSEPPATKETSTRTVIDKKRPAAVATKAAIKEVSASPIPPNVVAGSTVKTMLQVLAVASKRGKPGRKPKRDRKSLEWADSKTGISPGSSCHSSQKSPFSPQSSVGADSVSNPKYTHVRESSEGYKKKVKKEKEKKKKKRKKSDGTIWKTKHKNVIDPVLLGEVEHLIQDLLSLQISSKMSKDFWPDRPRDSVPSIFRRRKIIVGRSKSGNAVAEKPAAKRGRPKKSAQQQQQQQQHPTVSMTSEKAISDFDALIASSSDAAEQRLPLKKRHHHHIAKDQSSFVDSESGNSSSGKAWLLKSFLLLRLIVKAI